MRKYVIKLNALLNAVYAMTISLPIYARTEATASFKGF